MNTTYQKCKPPPQIISPPSAQCFIGNDVLHLPRQKSFRKIYSAVYEAAPDGKDSHWRLIYPVKQAPGILLQLSPQPQLLPHHSHEQKQHPPKPYEHTDPICSTGMDRPLKHISPPGQKTFIRRNLKSQRPKQCMKPAVPRIIYTHRAAHPQRTNRPQKQDPQKQHKSHTAHGEYRIKQSI